jgi:diaminopimelate epimerase
MKIEFTKMHGLGNDFVVIDCIHQNVQMTAALAARLADRKRGVGCDQVLLVEAPINQQVDFRYRIFNSDGSEAEQCGNGARCFAQFVRKKGLTSKTSIVVETLAGVFVYTVLNDVDVLVEMGVPKFEPDEIPLRSDTFSNTYSVQLDGQTIEFSAVSMGNPHAVLFVNDIDTAPVNTIGPALESHPMFPKKTNVQFIQPITKNKIRQRIFERGAGETSASGSGACAAVAVGQMLGMLGDEVDVIMPGGSLKIKRQPDSGSILMQGPANFSFEGSIEV